MKNITLITPTGDRPLAFALCQRWIKNQTMKAFQWIVVDDGKVPMKPYVPMQYVRREPQPNDPKCTLTLNLKVAFSLIKGDKIIIIEDDEYYAPKYVEKISNQLDKHELVGIGNTKYYHLFSGGNYRHGNFYRASLAQTAFRRTFLALLGQIVNENIGVALIDSVIWRHTERWKGGCGFVFVDENNDPLYVGIKGLPGRLGIIGHRPQETNYRTFDKSQTLLKQWIPKQEDYNIYMAIITKKLTEENYQSWLKI